MAIRTYGQMLEDIDTAIMKIEGGAQRYEIDGRVVWRADLAELRRERENLIRKVELYGEDGIPGAGATYGAYRVEFE